MKQSIGRAWGTFWHNYLVYVLVGALIIALLWVQLGSLIPGGYYSQPELLARIDASSLNRLLANPLFLPHKFLQYLLLSAGLNSPFWMRSVSALFGLVIVVVFYDIIRSWYSRRIAYMGSWLLVTSAWFLHLARLGTPTIMFCTSIALLWVGMRLRSVTTPRVRTIFASIIALLTCVYVPGLVWAILPMLWWQRRLIWREFAKIPRALVAVTWLGVGLALAPLVYGLVRTPSLVRSWLYLPQAWEPSVWLSNLWHIPSWMAFRGPDLPVYWLGRVPLFDVFSLVMLLLGAFVLNYYRLLDRVRAIVAIICLSLILAVFNGWIALAIGLPLLFVVISAGVALFLQQWFTVFPRNPLARGFGIAIVSFVVLLAGAYNLRAYFVAWPRNIETRQEFIYRG